jgi:3-dehydroquinate synthase class II
MWWVIPLTILLIHKQNRNTKSVLVMVRNISDNDFALEELG